MLDALTEESALIADAVARSADPTRWKTGQTAKAWVARRNKYQRVSNHKVSDWQHKIYVVSYCTVLRDPTHGRLVEERNTMRLTRLKCERINDVNNAFVWSTEHSMLSRAVLGSPDVFLCTRL